MLMEWMSKTLKSAKSIGRISVMLPSTTETAIGDHVAKHGNHVHQPSPCLEDIFPYFTSLYLVIAGFWPEAAS